MPRCMPALNPAPSRPSGFAPDEDHPYGHEKFETLRTLGIVGFLSISCFELLRQSFAELVGIRTLSRRVARTPR
jgi:divalent metal cation (Fe/Co/Zn/Cd) transporter